MDVRWRFPGVAIVVAVGVAVRRYARAARDAAHGLDGVACQLRGPRAPERE